MTDNNKDSFMQKAKDTITEFGEKAGEFIGGVKKQASDFVEGFVRHQSINVIRLKDSAVHVLLPEGYCRTKEKRVVEGMGASGHKEARVFRKETEGSVNVIAVKRCGLQFNGTFEEEFRDTEKYARELRDQLTDNEELMEIAYGVTSQEYTYFYCLAKAMPEAPQTGVSYRMTLLLKNHEEIIEINGVFAEPGTSGMTGMREALCCQLARQAGMVGEGFDGWFEDDDHTEMTKRCRRNLSEREGLDGLFPYHPLTQAHELLLAVIKNEYVNLTRDENEASDEKDPQSDEDGSSAEDKEENENDFIRGLFVNECRRYTYPVDIGAMNEKGSEKQNDRKD